MPEGDSYTRVAALLRPGLEHRLIRRADGVPSVRAHASRLVGATIESVRTRGKHLLLDVDGGLTIHVWMGMPGWWRVDDGAGRRRREGEFDDRADPGAIRLLLRTDDMTATCYSAPLVEVGRRVEIEHALRRLGPDVLDEDFDVEEFSKRASLLPGSTQAADLLLDQRVLAGVGNEYKNEVLFLEGVHPSTPIGQMSPEQLVRLAERARRIMLPNAWRRGARDTTGLPGTDSWVYGRAGRPCRRCRCAIQSAHLGARHARISYWCPNCQPPPT